MDQLKEMGEFVRSASSTIEAPVVRRLKEAFSAKAADQPAQGNQGGQGSRPRPGAPAVAREGAAAGGARLRPDASPAPVAQGGRDDRAVAAASTAAAPRTAPDGTANGSAERAAAPGGAAASGTSSAPDAAASQLPPVPPSPASGSAEPRPQDSPGAPRVPGPPRTPATPADFRSPGGGQPRPPAPRPSAPAGASGQRSGGPGGRQDQGTRPSAPRPQGPGAPRPGAPRPVHQARAREPRVPARGRVTTRSARPRPAWVRRLRPGPRVRPRLAREAVPPLRAVPAALVLADAARVAPRGPARPRAARVPAGSRVRVLAAPGRVR